MNRIGPDLFSDFLLVKRADTLGQNPLVWEKKLAYLDRVEQLQRGILERGDCLTLRELKVNGADLKEAGMAPGPQIGVTLGRMLQDVLETPEHNDKAYLMEQLRSGRYQQEDAPETQKPYTGTRHPEDFG